nr:hypothetical protein [Candidatus Levybacteria bacterium]
MAKKKNSVYSTFPFRFLVVFTIVALSLLVFKNLVQDYQGNNVLGTSSYLADKGSNDSGGSLGDSTSGSSDNTVQDQEKSTNVPQQEVQISQFSLENLKELRVRTEENKTKIKLDSKGGSFELESENGKLKIKAKEQDGTELKLEDESLDDINDALEEEGIHVASTSGNNLRIRRGLFEAETHFPLSINPTTNQLTVTTPAGVKNVAVLPDQAVANLLKGKFIDTVASGSATENPTGIKLGLLGNNPVFQITGIDEQKLLGFIPVSVNKTSFVSAQNGQIIKIDETLFNRLLDLLSL